LNGGIKIKAVANKAGKGNKLVTIFARHLDSFIMTPNLSLICQIRDFRLWTNPFNRDNLILRRDLQKLRHTRLATGTIFWLKYQYRSRMAAPGNAYSLYQPAVMLNKWPQLTY
jgi:hypothetical protein